MEIEYDLSSLIAWYNITGRNRSISNNPEKPPSGLESDYAAEEAEWHDISEKIRSGIRDIDAVTKSTKESVSHIQTMDDALKEMQIMLIRMLELATQASKNVNDKAIDRKALDREFQQLKREVDRIAESVDLDWNQML